MALALPFLIPFAEAAGITISAVATAAGIDKLSNKVEEYIEDNPENAQKIFAMIMPEQGLANILKNESDGGDEDIEYDDFGEEITKTKEEPKLTGKEKGMRIKEAIRRARAGRGNYSSPDAEGPAVDIRGSVIREVEDMGIADKDLKDNYDPNKKKFNYKRFYKKKYANGGGVGSMMQPKRGLVNGPGGYAGEVVPHFSESLSEPGKKVFDAMTRGGHEDQTKIDQLTLLGYYGGGADASTVPTTPVATPLPNSSGGGGGGIADIPNNIISTPTVNTNSQQNLLDQGIGLQGAVGDPVVAMGEMPVTQNQMDDFNAIPVTNVAEFPTGDASLAEQIETENIAAKALADEQALTNQEDYRMSQYDSPTPTVFDGTATLQDAGAGEGDMYTTDFQGGEPLSFDDRNQSIEDINRVDAPYGVNSMTGEAYQTPRSISDQNAVLGQTFETPEQTSAINNVFNNAKNLGMAGVDNLRDGLTALGGKVVGGFDNVIEIGGKSIDIGKSIAGGALSYMAGIPGIGLAAVNALPERDQRQNELDNLYDVENGTIQSGLMQGYNPVSGNPLDPNFGLQDAYQKRIDTIAETIARKSAADKNYDPTELQNRSNQLEIDKAKEQDVLNLYEGDINPEGTGDGSIAEKIEATNRLGIPDDIGVEGENEGRFNSTPPEDTSSPVTGTTKPGTGEQLADTSSPVTGVNPFAKENFGSEAGEFDTTPGTGTETVLGKEGIGTFDDAETGIELDPSDPSEKKIKV